AQRVLKRQLRAQHLLPNLSGGEPGEHRVVVRVTANGVSSLREREDRIAPVSRRIRKLAGKASRGREKCARELERVEHRNGVLELIGITAVEGQQRGGTGEPASAVQPFRELRQGKHGVPTLREHGHLVGKPLTHTNLVITEDENVS